MRPETAVRRVYELEKRMIRRTRIAIVLSVSATVLALFFSGAALFMMLIYKGLVTF
jgi:hypothetical protein